MRESSIRHRRIWLLIASVLCAAGTWLYASRGLISYQIRDSAANDIPRGNLSDLYPRWLGARELLMQKFRRRQLHWHCRLFRCAPVPTICLPCGLVVGQWLLEVAWRNHGLSSAQAQATQWLRQRQEQWHCWQ